MNDPVIWTIEVTRRDLFTAVSLLGITAVIFLAGKLNGLAPRIRRTARAARREWKSL